MVARNGAKGWIRGAAAFSFHGSVACEGVVGVGGKWVGDGAIGWWSWGVHGDWVCGAGFG